MDTSGERFVPNARMGTELEIEHMHRYMAIAEKVKGMRVLDAACGVGYGSAILSVYAREVVGIDIDEEAVAFARETYGNERTLFYEMSIADMQFKENSFDAVVSFETVEHVPEEIQKAFLQEIARILSPAGVLIMSTPDHDMFVKKFLGKYNNPYHVKEYNYPEYKALLKNYFKYVEICYQERIECSVIEGKSATTLNDLDHLEQGDYMIALCSQEPITMELASVYLPRTDRKSINSFLYWDSGKGYNEEEKECLVNFPSEDGEFEIEIDLHGKDGKRYRFDPVDFPADVALQIFDQDGREIQPLGNNSTYAVENGKLAFVHYDAQYEFEVAEGTGSIRMKGKFRRIDKTDAQTFWINKYFEAQKNISDLQKREQVLETKVHSYTAEINKLIEDDSNKCADYEKRILAKQKEIQVLQSEKEAQKISLQSEINALMDELEKQRTTFRNEIHSLKEHLAQEIENSTSLEEQLTQRTEEKVAICKKLRDVKRQTDTAAFLKDLENEQRKKNESLLQESISEITQERDELRNSYSWRSTKVFRWLFVKIRSFLGKIKRKIVREITQSSTTSPVSLSFDDNMCYRNTLDGVEIPDEWVELLPNKPLISLVVAVKEFTNRKVCLTKMLTSVMNQQYKNIEMVVVTTRAEMEAVKLGLDQLCKDALKLSYVIQDDGTDIHDFWKLGVEKAEGEYIGIVEQEDTFEKSALSFFAEVLNEFPAAKVITCHDDVIWDNENRFIDQKLGIEFAIGGEYSLLHFSLMHKNDMIVALHSPEEYVSTLTKADIKVIPGCLYHTNPEHDVWKRNDDVKCIAFYLPQFHAIKENDEWWGKGFTEWTNVTKARPLYEGHNQPRVPGRDIGYYSLGDDGGRETQLKQIEMAKKYGLSGFCYYYYWFDNGKRLLEKPLDRMLNDKSIDFPFCLCWANENWTRSWDGLNTEVLLPQTYMENWEEKFAEDILPYLKDERYIKVNGAPYLLIYNVAEIKDPKKAINHIREIASENGIKRLHISAVRRTLDTKEFEQAEYCLDSVTDFPPHLIGAVGIDHDDPQRFGLGVGQVKDYRKACDYHANMGKQLYTYFRTAILEWDNTARRGDKAYIFEEFSFDYYKKWLYAIKRYTMRQNRFGENLLFVNAWNEWAEGTCLEPDEKNGYAALEATKEVLEMR